MLNLIVLPPPISHCPLARVAFTCCTYRHTIDREGLITMMGIILYFMQSGLGTVGHSNFLSPSLS